MTKYFLLSIFLLSNFLLAKDYGKNYCAIMKIKNNDNSFAINYEGDDYYLCCTSCVRSFKKNPEKYIKMYKNFEALLTKEKVPVWKIKRGDLINLSILNEEDLELFLEGYKLGFKFSKTDKKEIEFIGKKVGEFNLFLLSSENKKNIVGKLIVEK